MAQSTPSEPSGAGSLRAELRRFDYDRYLCTLFAPPAARDALFALYAFNLEVAKIRELVSEPMLGEIRLQWWREAVEGIYGGATRRHQCVEALAAAIGRHDLPRAPFDALIDARAFDLTDGPPATLGDLEAYADVTSGALQVIALNVLGGGREDAVAAARSAGIAWALVGLIRAVPFHAGGGRLYLPADLLDAAGVSRDALTAGRPGPAIAEIARTVAECAQGYLARARAAQGTVPRSALPAVLPARLAGVYLARLAAAGYDPFAPRAEPGPLGKQARLLAARLSGRY